MPKKMLIDATHAEETRVVVVEGNKVEEFDFESLNKRQLAGNIYLAKVIRVEPSLQAAFVDYGGNRHGFLAFSEIHPDYYQIPAADREKLLAEEEAYAKAMAAEDAKEKPKSRRRRRGSRSKAASDGAPKDSVVSSDVVIDVEESGSDLVDVPESSGVKTPAEPVSEAVADTDASPSEVETPEASAEEVAVETPATDATEGTETTEVPEKAEAEVSAETAEPVSEKTETEETASEGDAQKSSDDVAPTADTQDDAQDADQDNGTEEPVQPTRDKNIQSVADDDVSDEVRPRKPRPRRYKIQEVIKVRQIMLVQVVKEERGNKGAALTTYLSLAGRYCVLMPNTARGGGISRKITNATDRKKLKSIANEIEVPKGAGLIIRTAGAKRNKTDIKRDYEYLQRQWEQIRELTLKSIAPAQIYAEGDLIKRSIRDLYNREIDEILVEGNDGYEVAKEYMTMLLPNRMDRVKLYTDPMPLFARYQVEGYLSGMFNPTVQLKSGGYIVIGVTEALVAIDVNSGKATKESSIEDTALRTNLEAAEEVARQLRLRDLAGLIVIDFIDMEERRNNNAVERKMKDKLKNDRARIQISKISGFGLMEMSRQRLRPGMIEATTAPCPACHGTGIVRSDDNQALAILRELEEEGVRQRSKEVLVTAPVAIANYILNAKREHVAMIESRYGMSVRIEADPMLISPDYKVETFKTATRIVQAPDAPLTHVTIESAEVETAPAVASESEEQPKKRRRRRRRRGGRSQDNTEQSTAEQSAPKEDGGKAETEAETPPVEDAVAEHSTEAKSADVAAEAAPAEKPKRKRAPRKKKVVAEAPAEEAKTDAAEEGEKTPEAEAAPAEKPKRKRAPRKKKVVAEAPAEEATAEPAEDAEKAPEAETAPAEKPKRKRAPRKKKVVAEAPVEEAKAEEPAPASEAEATPEPAPATAEPAPELVGATAEPEQPAAPPKPKKKGWWSR
jgi:ribonuclease E